MNERQKEQTRLNHRQAAEKALRELWPKLGNEAKRQLAQHHAMMIVCGDLEELRIWSDHLARHFGGHPTGKEVAFVQWVKTESNLTIGILVWYPGGSADLKYNLAHEVGHLIDRDAAQQRLSETREFASALARDLNALIHILFVEREQQGFVV